MRKLLFVLVLLIVLFISCKKVENSDPLIDSYYYPYMDYPQTIIPNSHVDNIVKLNYSGDKIVKRIGGLISINPAVGYDYEYSNDVYDSLSYIDNILSIIKKIKLEGYWIPPDARTIYFDNSNRMIRQICKNYNHGNHPDTTDYKYSSAGLLNEADTKVEDYYTNTTSYFFYNSKENLDSIVTIYFQYDNFFYKKIEIFQNFDNAPNPLKNLKIFNETFNRSLSKNNYQKYRMQILNSDNIVVEEHNKTWTLIYDNNGNPLFNKY